MNEKEVMEKINEGHILAKTIIEVLGRPKDHVEKTLKLIVDKIKESKDIEIIKEKSAEAIEQEGNMFSTFTESKLLFKNIDVLFDFCLDFMPSSIDILEPISLEFESVNFNSLLNDFLANLHKIDMFSKNLKMENDILKKNTRTLLTNLVVVSLKEKSKTLNQLAKHIGVGEDKLPIFLEDLTKKKIIIKSDNKYEIAK